MAYVHILLLVLCPVVALAQAAPPKPSAVVFNPANVVANATGKDCPVKNVLFDKKEFDVDELPQLTDTLRAGNVSQKCQDDAVTNLVSCFTDGSLAIKSGCCSKDCAGGIKESIDSGCFTEYAVAICKDKTALRFLTGLTNAGKRCANFTTSCEEALAAAPKSKANATAGADSKAAGADSNAAGSKATGAPAAAAPAAPAAQKSSSTLTSMSTLPLVAAVVAMLVL